MAIFSIGELGLYFKTDQFHPERAGSSYFPMVALLSADAQIIAAIRYSYGVSTWHVDNVVAKSGYGPTIYLILMQLAGANGIAPSFKHSNLSKEFIAQKSKDIWLNFFSSSDAQTLKMEEKYAEPHLNYRYILRNQRFNMPQAFRRLQTIIINNHVKNLTFRQRLQLIISNAIDPVLLRKTEEIYIKNLEGRISHFLEESVNIHRAIKRLP